LERQSGSVIHSLSVPFYFLGVYTPQSQNCQSSSDLILKKMKDNSLISFLKQKLKLSTKKRRAIALISGAVEKENRAGEKKRGE